MRLASCKERGRECDRSISGPCGRRCDRAPPSPLLQKGMSGALAETGGVRDVYELFHPVFTCMLRSADYLKRPSAAAVTTESDSSEELPASEGTSSHLSEPSTSADTHTSVGPRPHLVGVAHGESPHTCEHEQTPVARAAVESPHQWVHSSPGSAQLDADAQPWGPSFKRRMIEWQQHICEVLEEVPRALSAIAERMEESIGYGLNRDLGFMSRYT
ncbi:uncharacterized protein [Heptranchias perlo]|uniref:uncharacterized protein isoform X4 n=1 Tax=Heptranchias perlo TaxID=212740 RepID=UPI00355A035F